MKQILCISAVVLAALVFSLDVTAQGPGQGRQPGQGVQQGQFGNTLGTLLRNAEVVKLLNITEAQTTSLNEALRPQQRPATGDAPQRPTPAETRARTEAQWESVGKILNADQLKKFKEIYFQASVPAPRPNAPADAPARQMNLNVFVLSALDLTAEQKEKINKINDDAATAAASVTRLGQDATQEERNAFMTAAQERTTKTNDAIKAVLTDAQKKKMDELTAGAAKVRTDLNLNQGRGQGNAPGAGGAGGGQGQGRPNRGEGGGQGGGQGRGNRGGGN